MRSRTLINILICICLFVFFALLLFSIKDIDIPPVDLNYNNLIKTEIATDNENEQIVTLKNVLYPFDRHIDYNKVKEMVVYDGDTSTSVPSDGLFTPPVVVTALNQDLIDKTNFYSENNSCIKFEDMIDYISNSKLPAIIWITEDYNVPQKINKDSELDEFNNAHMVIVTGINDKNVRFSDSLKGDIDVPIDVAKILYNSCGKQCVLIKHK